MVFVDLNEVPLSKLLEHPIVKELSGTVDYLTNGFKLPYVEKDIVLMSPGVWNEYYYSKEEINKAYDNTGWSDRYVTALYYDHEDKRSSEWIGEVKNIRSDKGTGFLYGDLYYYEPNTAIKMSLGKPKSGVSPKVEGSISGKCMTNFVFRNFSHVINPAVKTAYINNSEGSEPVMAGDTNKLEAAARSAGVGEHSEVSGMPNDAVTAPAINPAEKPLGANPMDPAAAETKTMEFDKVKFMEEMTALMRKYGMMGGEAPKPQVPPIPAMGGEEMKKDIPIEASKEMDSMKTAVKEMSQEIQLLRNKLKEPEDKVVVTNSSHVAGNSDEAMMRFLQKRIG